MGRLFFLIGVIAAAFYVFAIVDCAMFDRARIRGLSKPMWIVVIVVFPLIGAALWFLAGRGPRRETRQRRTVAPDDDPDFLNRIGTSRRREQDERIKRLEEELARLDDKSDPDHPGRKDG